MTPKFGVKLGVKVTPKGVILCLTFLLHFWSYNNSLKITVQPIDCSTSFYFILPSLKIKQGQVTLIV